MDKTPFQCVVCVFEIFWLYKNKKTCLDFVYCTRAKTRAGFSQIVNAARKKENVFGVEKVFHINMSYSSFCSACKGTLNVKNPIYRLSQLIALKNILTYSIAVIRLILKHSRLKEMYCSGITVANQRPLKSGMPKVLPSQGQCLNVPVKFLAEYNVKY